MNIPKYPLESQKIIYFFLAVMLIGGIYSFFKLPKKEDLPFVIKQVVLVTQYPGTTPQEVEKLVTEPVEREIQAMSGVFQIRSEPCFGMSKVSIELQPALSPNYMPVKWSELRRKAANIRPHLLSGASSVSASGGSGDVFGIYCVSVVDKRYTYDDLRNWAQKAKTELPPIPGVRKVHLFGGQTQVANVKISIPKLANLGIDPNAIQQVIQTQNSLVNTGDINTGNYQPRLRAEGTYKDIQDIRDQLIVMRNGGEVYLGDIATVERGYTNPPSDLMHVDDKRIIGVDIATGSKDDMVVVGSAVVDHLAEMEQLSPVSMDLKTIYPESKITDEVNSDFTLNLIESLLIVIMIIFIVMGSRAGMLVGSSLLFSVGGTLLITPIWGVGLNRAPLAAPIIAIGMSVDNVTVVADNAQVGIKRGLFRYQALVGGAMKPQWVLLGAAFVTVCSFSPMYLAPAFMAEVVKLLSAVLAVSLGLNWVLALMQIATFGNFILKEAKPGENKDPYDTKLYHKFGSVLGRLIKCRYTTISIVIATLLLSLFVMSIMPQSFFPIIGRSYFRANLISPEGYGIYDVGVNTKKIEEEYLSKNEDTKSYSFTLGGSPVCCYLASPSIGPKPNFVNVLIETQDPEDVQAGENKFYDCVVANYLNILIRSALFALSPVPDTAIEVGFIDDSVDTLVVLTQRAQEVTWNYDQVTEVRNSQSNRAPVWKSLYSQGKDLCLGITRQQVAYSLRSAMNDIPLGEHRGGDVPTPILLKDVDKDSISLNDIKALPVYNAKGCSVKVEQVIDDLSLDYEFNVVRRFNREPCMLMQCESKRGTSMMAAFSHLWKEMQEKIQVPEGYKMTYFGEQSEQDEGNKAIVVNTPLMFGLIYVTSLFLFPKYCRKPVLIIAALPLTLIGVILGLLTFDKSLDFFAMPGLLGLIGMNIKNVVVPAGEIGLQLNAGLSPVNAMMEATKTHIVPMAMTSGTTILGMLPLLGGAILAGMAATITDGLFVSTILTIFVPPVIYCVFFKIKSE